MNAEAGGDDCAGKRSRRVDAVDCARGLALAGMAVYHLSWDLADFRLAPPMLPFTPPMRLLSHVVASVFLALVGVSLALAHRNGLNLRTFWRRLAIVAGAAAAYPSVSRSANASSRTSAARGGSGPGGAARAGLRGADRAGVLAA